MDSVNFDEICRLCMKTNNQLTFIFQDERTEFHPNIKQMIMEFTTVQILQNDGLPSNVCVDCVEKTQHSYEFKKQCEYSDVQLRNYLKTNDFNTILKNELPLEVNSDDARELNKLNRKRKKVKKEMKTKKRKMELNRVIDNGTVSAASNNFQCTLCPQSYTTEKQLNKHCKSEHSENFKITCDVCNQTFSQMQTLQRHKKLHQGNQRNHLCTICGKSFHRADDLRRHMRIHTNERPYTCTQCPKSYKQSSELTDHLKSHSDVKSYICTECGKSLATRNGLYVHMKVHRGEKNHECNICGNKYVTTGELTSHINHIHSQAKPFICSFDGCSRAFVTKLSLVTHTRTHTGEKPYQCLICNKFLSTASSLHDHKRTHTGEKLKKCDICDLKLGNVQALKKHLRIHSGERPYRCNICFDSFTCSSSLSSHIKIKHLAKEHQCLECKKMFALPSKLRQHMKVHNKNNYESDKTEQDAARNNQDLFKTNNEDKNVVECNKIYIQDCKNELIQNPQSVKIFQHNPESYKACSNLRKPPYDLPDCKEENKRAVQMPLDTRLISQLVTGSQISISQMIVPHYM